ncbi:MAG: DUF4340 domain-containing protein [Candidatus Glassbacteria bacterium]|nr:DUF4340 domain-containing protein [Candidatus Glassbacteria bacterium]
MNWKIILVLLVVCLGLGAYLYLEMGSEASRPAGKKQVEYLMSYDQDRVEGLRVFFLDTLFQVKRSGSEWEMVEPQAGTHADSAQVNHLLRTLTRIPVLRSISTDSVSLAQLYLDRPAVYFTVYLQGGDSSTVGFGLWNPTTDNLYARRDHEDRVLLTAKEMGPMLYVGSALIRSKQLISVAPHQVSRIRLLGRQGLESALDRDPETGEWAVRPAKVISRADKHRVLEALKMFYGDQVREFLGPRAGEGTATGLSRPVRRLVVAGGRGDSIVVSFGDPQRGREYLRWAASSIYPDNLLLVDTKLVDKLGVLLPDSIVDLHITDFDREGLDRIELVYDTDKIVLAAELDTLWRIVEPEEAHCRFWQVERLLTHADTMQAYRILPPGGGRGFERPQLEMTISAGSKAVARILIGNYKADSLYMRDELRGIDFLAPSSELERLSFTLKDLADVQLRHVVE